MKRSFTILGWAGAVMWWARATLTAVGVVISMNGRGCALDYGWTARP